MAKQTERGKAAYENYVDQIRAMDRATLERLAICALMETLSDHGGGIELEAAEYFGKLPDMPWPEIITPTALPPDSAP